MVDQAQAFTTGDNTAGYTLTSVEIDIYGATDFGSVTVSINSDSSGSPGASLGTLTNPTSVASDNIQTFMASGSGITLAKETTYFIVLDVTGTQSGALRNTGSNNEDANPAANWSIGDESLYRNRGETGAWTSWHESKKIRINGTVGTTTTLSTDATLSDLALEDNTGTAITLTPTFVSATTSYTAMVANSVDEITIAPTVNESNAEYEIQDGTGTELTDADLNTTGFQVALSEGASTIKVEVTAEDDSTTETYEVVVTRATATPPLTHCETGDIWCATMTVAELTSGGLTLGHGYNSTLNQGALAPDEFEYDGTDYMVSGLIVTPGFDTPLRIGFDPSGEMVFNTDNFFLYVDGTAFLFDDATFVSADQFQWASARLSWSTGDTVELRLVERSGTAATGKPTIRGTARVGQTLTADISGIADDDGLVNVSYSYQWIRVQNLVEAEISGATASTYTPVADDVGKTIRVKVTFTDDADNPETAISDSYPTSGTVLPATPTVSISADNTTAVFKEDGITYTLTRTGSTTAALDVSVFLAQTKDFLLAADLTKTVTIAVGQSTKTFTVAASSFQNFAAGTRVEAGTLTATVQDGTDYDLGTQFAVDVAIVIGVMVRLDMASYTVGEATGTLSFKLIARTGPGAPQPSSATSFIEVVTENGTASKDTDFAFTNLSKVFVAADFSADGGVWKAEEPYTVSITNDDLDEDAETFNLAVRHATGAVSYSLVDASGNSCGTKCTAPVTIVDDDTAGVTVSKSALTVTEQDATGDTYTVVLNSRPTANVTITIGGQSGTDVTAAPSPMTFTPMNWNTAQTVTVTAGNDTNTANETVSLTHSAASTDTDYSGITIAGVTVTVTDNDNTGTAATGAPAITGTAQVGKTLMASKGTIADADGTTKADNGDSGYAYTYQWVRVDGGTETAITGATAVTYMLAAADLGKTIKVRASFKDDGDTAEGPLTSGATAAVAALPGVTVSKSTLTVAEQNTTGDSYTVVLNSQPTATVTVTVAGHAGTDVTPTPTTLTFTNTTWAMAQTVTVTAGNDTNTANETVSLTHSAASTDTDYSGITIAGVTVTVIDNDGSNTAPVFTGGTTQARTLAETVGGATAGTAAVGGPVSATDADNNTLTYSLGGTDAGKFGFVTSSGQIRTRAGVRYDFEAKASYSVTVTVTDGTVSVTAAVTINITNTNETPLAPAAPTVTATSGSTSSLNVSWDAPNNTGRPTITGYDLRYRAGTSGGWTDGPQDVSGTSASIAGLTADTSYEVQVRAVNGDGGGAWSGAGDGRTSAAARTPEVRFGAPSYTAIEGAAGVVVTVELSAAAASAVTITLTEDPQGGATSADYSGVPGSVTFAAGETEQTFTVTAADDSVDDDGESVRLGFGPLPSGVQLGSPSTATVALVQDAGVSTWYVWFGESDYTVAEGGSARITLHLNAPWKPELNEALTVPLFDPQHEGGASADDYSGVPESVTFQPGQTRASFTVRATDDSDDDDGESVLLHFRRLFPDDLEAGRYGARVATLHIDDDDGETAVTVSFESANYTAAEGGAAATVRLLLDAAPGRSVTIELTATGRGGATSADYSVPSSVTFGASETVKSFMLTATDDAADDDLESVAIGFGSLPSGVAAGSPSVAVVNLTDNDGGTEMLTVNFGSRAGTVRDGVEEGGGYFLNFRLDRKPGRKLTIPLTYAYLGGATAADFTDLPSAVTFGKKKTSSGVTIRPVDDFDVDPGESIQVSFGTMPAGVQVGSYGGRSTIIPVIDNDGPPGLSVADASAREWPNKRVCLVFEVTLDREVEHEVSVDYATADGTAVAGQDYKAVSGTLEFRKDQDTKRLCVEVIYDGIDDSTEEMTLRLSNPVRAYLSDATATGSITSYAAAADRSFDGESEAVARVAGLSVEALAQVLFGEAELSADQRAAFDDLGNRNGVLDLGDLLSWRARCQQNEVSCGAAVSATDAGSLPASPAMPPTKRNGRTPPRRRGGARAGRRSGRNMGGSVECVPQRRAMRSGVGRGPGRRGPAVRRATGWIRALALGLVASAWGCGIGDNPVQPAQPDPGPLHVQLTVPPEARDIGAMLVVEGPGIDSLSAPGFELIQADEASSNRREAIIAGSLYTGPVLQVWVPDRRQLADYRVELMQVSGDDYGLEDLTQYGIAISR